MHFAMRAVFEPGAKFIRVGWGTARRNATRIEANSTGERDNFRFQFSAHCFVENNRPKLAHKIDIFIPQHDTAARHDYHRFRGVQFSQHLCFNFAEFFFAEFGKDLPDRQTKLKCSHFVRIKSTAPRPSLQGTPDRRFTRAHHSNKHNRSRGTHATICERRSIMKSRSEPWKSVEETVSFLSIFRRPP